MRFKVEHRVGVPASSKAIWDVLSDLPRWKEWNTVYPEIHGLLRIQQGDAPGAAAALRSAVTAKGYEYDVYALALARVLAKQGNTRDARVFARQATQRGDPTDLRLELERPRRDAARLLAQLGG